LPGRNQEVYVFAGRKTRHAREAVRFVGKGEKVNILTTVAARLVAPIMFVALLTISVGASFPVRAAAASLSDTYLSIALSIETAKGNGIATLNVGRFSGNDGDLQFVVINKNTNEMAFKFDYHSGAIYSGTVDFKGAPLVVVASRNGVCVAVEIQLIIVRPGGFLDEANSKFRVINNHPDCRNPKYELAGAVAGLFKLPLLPSPFFAADWFNWQSSIRRCPPGQCADAPNRSAASLFKVIVFLPDVQSRRLPDAPGLTVDFADHGSIELGHGDSLLLGADSGLVFAVLSIDVEHQAVMARMKNVKLNLVKGVITADGNQFIFGSGTKFEAFNFDIDGKNKTVTFKGTNISGTATSGTKLTISNGTSVPATTVTFASASLTLNGIDLSITNDHVRFSVISGRFESALQDADLRLGQSIRLFLRAATFNVTFGCPLGSPADCRPLVAETGQPLVSIGTIDPLSITTTAGSYEAPSLGKIELDRGELTTGTLGFDSRQKGAPIWGDITRIAVDVSSQYLQLNPGLQLRAASGTLRGEDLKISSKDSRPVGDLRFHADVIEIVIEGLGQFAALRGKATMDALLRRNEGQDIHLLDGLIRASIVATTDGGVVTSQLLVSDLDLFAGNGGARFSLDVPSFTYRRTIPGHEESEGSLAEVIVRSRPEVLEANLDEVKLDRRKIDIRSGKWTMEKTVFGMRAALSLSDQTIVEGEVKAGGVHVCTSTVKLPFANYVANFTGEIVLVQGRLGFHTTPFVINPFPQPAIDSASCKRAVTFMCGFAGGVFGPIGSVGTAYLCNTEFGKAEQELQDNLNKLVRDGIQSTRFDIGA
jgi:hypothetical protein